MAPNCPAFIIERAVRLTAIEFAEGTWAINEEHDPFDLDEGESNYSFDAPSSSRIIGVLNVRVDGKQIDLITHMELVHKSTDWRSDTAEYPTRYQVHGSDLLLYPTPTADVDDAVEALIAVAPTYTATRVHNDFQDKYFPAIIAGATARVCLQPDKEWTNPQLAAINQAEFMSFIYSARNKVANKISRETPAKAGI